MEIDPLVQVIATRKKSESKLRTLELSQAALVPYMKKREKEAFFKSLAIKVDSGQDITKEQREKTNQSAKNILSSYGL